MSRLWLLPVRDPGYLSAAISPYKLSHRIRKIGSNKFASKVRFKTLNRSDSNFLQYTRWDIQAAHDRRCPVSISKYIFKGATCLNCFRYNCHLIICKRFYLSPLQTLQIYHPLYHGFSLLCRWWVERRETPWERGCRYIILSPSNQTQKLLLSCIIVNRGNWLWNLVSNKSSKQRGQDGGWKVYDRAHLLFCTHTLCMNFVIAIFLLVSCMNTRNHLL